MKNPQKADQIEKAKADPTSLGNLLIQAGLIDGEKLMVAVRGAEDRKLGEYLVDAGAITSEQLGEILQLQQTMRGKDRSPAAVTRLLSRASAMQHEVVSGLEEVSTMTRGLTQRVKTAC